jgi:hypothetical protein
MGVFARLLRRSAGSSRKPADGAAQAAEPGAEREAKEQEVSAVTGTGDGSEEVGIPKQQSADGAADSDAADDARN